MTARECQNVIKADEGNNKANTISRENKRCPKDNAFPA